jgi:hypothetical protein
MRTRTPSVEYRVLYFLSYRGTRAEPEALCSPLAAPSAQAAHLMTMLQTLLVLLRTLPAPDSPASAALPGPRPGTSGSATAGPDAPPLSAAAAAALSAAGLFNVVLVPAGPPPDDDADLLSSIPIEPAPPVWLFPGGSQPVSGAAVAGALHWVEALLAEPAKLVAWAQPRSMLHGLLGQLGPGGGGGAPPRAVGARRAALLLCQLLAPRRDDVSARGGALGTAATTPSLALASAAPSAAVSRMPTLRRTTSSRRQLLKQLTFTHTGTMQRSLGPVPEGSEFSASRRSIAGALHALHALPPGPEAAAGGGSAEALTPRRALRMARVFMPTTPRDPMPGSAEGVAGGEASGGEGKGGAARGGGDGGGSAAQSGGEEALSPRRRPLSAVSSAASAAGTASPARSRAESEAGALRARAPPPPAWHRLNSAAPQLQEEEDDQDLDEGRKAILNAVPPPLDFPVFVLAHELPAPSTNAFAAAALHGGAGGALLGASGPSYLLAYSLYEK